MDSIVIKATFKGTNSLGYENGKEYRIKIQNYPKIYIQRIDGTGICTYKSLYSFLLNWTNIS